MITGDGPERLWLVCQYHKQRCLWPFLFTVATWLPSWESQLSVTVLSKEGSALALVMVIHVHPQPLDLN